MRLSLPRFLGYSYRKGRQVNCWEGSSIRLMLKYPDRWQLLTCVLHVHVSMHVCVWGGACAHTLLMLLVMFIGRGNEQPLPSSLAVISCQRSLIRLRNGCLPGALPCESCCSSFPSLGQPSGLSSFLSFPNLPLFQSLPLAFITLFSWFHSFIEAVPFIVFCI